MAVAKKNLKQTTSEFKLCGIIRWQGLTTPTETKYSYRCRPDHQLSAFDQPGQNVTILYKEGSK